MGVIVPSTKIRTYRGWCWLGVVLVGLQISCAPRTRYRRTALVPNQMGESLTTPVGTGNVQFTGSITLVDSSTNYFPVRGDPALHVATAMATTQLRLGLGKYFSMGMQGTAGHSSLSEPSAIGTPEIGDNFFAGAGPHVSIVVPTVNEQLSLGFALATGMNYRYAPMLFYGGLSFQNAMTNIGFDDDERTGSTLDGDIWGLVSYAGIQFFLGNHFFVDAQYFLPTGYGDFRTGNIDGGFMTTLGLQSGDVTSPE